MSIALIQVQARETVTLIASILGITFGAPLRSTKSTRLEFCTFWGGSRRRGCRAGIDIEFDLFNAVLRT